MFGFTSQKSGLFHLVKLFSHLKAVSVPYHDFFLHLLVISNYHCWPLFSLHITDSIAYIAVAIMPDRKVQ